MQAPFYRLWAQRLAADMPSQRDDSFCGDINVCFRLHRVLGVESHYRGCSTCLDRVKDLDHARMANRAKLSEGVSGQGEESAVGGNVEGKDAAVGAVLLDNTVSKT